MRIKLASLQFVNGRVLKIRKKKKRKRKKNESSFTTLHGIVLSLAIGTFVGLVFLLVALYWHPPE
jgi:uncharacterized ion transporter superfamily protein YfcC